MSDLTTENTESTERLVYTSVEDLKTQLKLAKMQGSLRELPIKEAHDLCVSHGYKTKAKLLKPHIQPGQQYGR